MARSYVQESPEVLRARLLGFAEEILTGARDAGVPTSPLHCFVLSQRQRRRKETKKEYKRFLQRQGELFDEIRKYGHAGESADEVMDLVGASELSDASIRFAAVMTREELADLMASVEGDALVWGWSGTFVTIEFWYDRF